MSPKSGSAGTPVDPAAPDEAMEADGADPGVIEETKAEQRKSKTGKYGAVSLKPKKDPATSEEKKEKKSWIEIELRDDEGQPMAGEPYRVVLPDGETAAEGTLDEKGLARVDGIEPGSCEILFPNRDKSSWKPK